MIDGAEVIERVDLAGLHRAWTPRPGLPGPTRASCPPPTEHCPYVHCSHHLAHVDASDRPGRRFARETRRTSTLAPIWLDGTAPTCELHLIDRAQREGWGMRRAAREMRMAPSRFFDVLAKAISKLRAAGLDPNELQPRSPV